MQVVGPIRGPRRGHTGDMHVCSAVGGQMQPAGMVGTKIGAGGRFGQSGTEHPAVVKPQGDRLQCILGLSSRVSRACGVIHLERVGNAP